jgi:hypothetical protein
VAIPLREDQARTSLNGLSAHRQPLTPRPTLGPETPADDVPDLTPVPQTPAPIRVGSEPRVTFASEPIPIPASNASTTSLSNSVSPETSGTSTPLSSSGSLSGPAPISKTLLNRLSFWSTPRTSLPPTLDTTPAVDTNSPSDGEIEPEQVLQRILAAENAHAPRSTEERNAELTKKVVREVVRQFGSGCMYYALDFGEFGQALISAHSNETLDLATSLQDKHDQANKAQRENTVTEDASVEGKMPQNPRRNSSSSVSSNSRRPSLSIQTDSTKMPVRTDAFAEPHPLLPLWLRVLPKSRRFWWNEALAAPFVEAGVCFQFHVLESDRMLKSRAGACVRGADSARALSKRLVQHRGRDFRYRGTTNC